MNLSLLSTLLLLAQPTFGRDFSSGDLAGYGSSNHRLRLLRKRKHKTKKSVKAEEKSIAADVESSMMAEIEEFARADGGDQGQTEIYDDSFFVRADVTSAGDSSGKGKGMGKGSSSVDDLSQCPSGKGKGSSFGKGSSSGKGKGKGSSNVIYTLLGRRTDRPPLSVIFSTNRSQLVHHLPHLHRPSDSNPPSVRTYSFP